ncbi:GDP-D-glucose phosphorylase 1-like isoform X1 [Argonauta hians]
MEYIYSPDEFQWNIPDFSPDKGKSLSKFDEIIIHKWNEAMQKGFFKYELNLKTRILPGKRGYIAQLNPLRFSERRKPQHIQSVNQGFDPTTFNFNKIEEREVLLFLKGSHWKSQGAENNLNNKIIINVSPLEYGHCLIVPEVDKCLPQAITPFGLQFAVEILLLSKHSGLCVGFNSLCALASVNHLHFHSYYLEQMLPVNKCKARYLTKNLYEILDWPASGFIFQLEGDYLETFIENVEKVVTYFQKEEIAHNIMIARGPQYDQDPTANNNNSIRLFLWPRMKFQGAKQSDCFNIALAELSGQLPIKDQKSFEEITEELVDRTIQDAAFNEKDFESLKEQVIALVS